MDSRVAVDTEHLDAVAQVIHGAAQDLQATRSSWNARTQSGGTHFGTEECAAVFTSVQDELFQQQGKHITHLLDLAEAAGASAGDYAGTDRDNAAGLERKS